MDWIGKIIGIVIGLVVGLIMVVNVLFPVIDGLTTTNETYKALIGVIGLLSLVILVVFAAKAITGKES